MERDPLEGMADAPLIVVPRMLDALRAFRPAFDGLPDAQRARLAAGLDDLRRRLLAGIEQHPTKFWVMKQFQRSLETMKNENAPARQQAGMALETLMRILGIDDRSGVVERYLGRP
jgi:hypothetical protein